MNEVPLIEIDHLTKRFGALTAVDALDLHVRAGEVYGLLGPNGAGKTTAIRSLMGFINPSRGRVRVLDGQPRDLDIRRRVGYVGGDVTFERNLRVQTLLTWYARLRGGPSWAEINELCEQLSLDPSRKIGQLSTGNRQKVAIVQAFMHEPDVLVLDEPTSGLDPLLQRSVLGLVRQRREDGAGVLFSSHLLPEVEDIADRIGILRRGVLVREDTIANIREIARQRLELRFADDIPEGLFDGVDGISSLEITGRTAHIVVDGSVAPLIDTVAGHGVERVVTHDEDLEDIFFGYYQDPDDEPAADRAVPGGPATHGQDSEVA
ncbi:ABC transporter ATP-binding protein [Actinobacteria bacterium YIM 96077]|uniref:ABC transporter ATP-binding protein n=1 Tax=Phytoactinopolyspora halophila TaxID=1981511 RepID=A0A329QF71_9ACTN|nr:ABC transporter ATP-binding protein [Phytoactinopolyspora halophila]AYY14053.1 ABC transporter ATP-binding protein [Actinobacteria bacterium YIM 96077]RAW10960.1 ABC transporter ATP-binding protein [Phytoactinopolyspora halophila]